MTIKMFCLGFLAAGMLCFAAGCKTLYLQGVTPEGEKAYLGPVPIENTEAYQTYLLEKPTEVSKQNYIFDRLRFAKHLEFNHNGSWYNSLEAYRGGKWLMQRRYQKGQDAREFIRKYVERAEDTGKYHLVKYPDGSLHIGSYVLYNELDLLEETLARSGRS